VHVDRGDRIADDDDVEAEGTRVEHGLAHAVVGGQPADE